jgi:epoxide hydrolase 4
VILLHGFPEMSYGWRHQIQELAQAGSRAVAPDQRGYGHSNKPSGIGSYRLNVLACDVIALARALGHESVRLVGHDWGGLVAWHLASEHASFVQRAAILNAQHPATLVRYLARSPMQALRSAYICFFQLPWLPEAALRAHDHALLKSALVGTSWPGTFSEEELRVYQAAWAIDGALSGMLNWYRALPLAPSLGDKRIHPPVRIIWGDRDAALHAELADIAAARCKRARVVHLRDATHWLHHERSGQVNELLSSSCDDRRVRPAQPAFDPCCRIRWYRSELRRGYARAVRRYGAAAWRRFTASRGIN